MADDMGFSDIGAYGATNIRTPNIDWLAQNGLRYTQFYNTARCSPTRASLLTGLYPHHAGVGKLTRNRGKPGYLGHLNKHCVTLAEVLQPEGYFTAVAGKWHVTPTDRTGGSHRPSWPLQRGFDRFTGTLAGGGNYFAPTGYMKQNQPAEPGDDFYYTRDISSASVQFIREANKKEQPLFLYVAYTAPHWPLHALKQDIQKYEGQFRNGWNHVRSERFSWQKKLGLADSSWTLTSPPESVTNWSDASAKRWEARRMAVYAAMIDRMDHGIGRILQVLKESGRLDNTLLMFLSDNGAARYTPEGDWINRYAAEGQDTSTWGTRKDVLPGGPDTFQGYGEAWANASNTPFRKFKKFTHEGGIATPFIVHWPKGFSARGEFRQQPGHVIDLMPTVLEVAGASYPDKYEGRSIHPMAGQSLVPTFKKDQTFQRTLFWEHNGHRAVLDGKWKLVSTKWNGNWNLYNLQQDRSETRDLADQFPERVGRMSELWQKWAERTNVVPRPSTDD